MSAIIQTTESDSVMKQVLPEKAIGQFIMTTVTSTLAGSTLDEPAWRAVCETQAALAVKGCGLSYDYYVDLFSAKIDARVNELLEHQRAAALQIAREWDYATPTERQEKQDWNVEHGYCSHGIEWDCCPLGCGDWKGGF